MISIVYTGVDVKEWQIVVVQRKAWKAEVTDDQEMNSVAQLDTVEVASDNEGG